MTVYKFTVTYATLSDYKNEEIVINGAENLVDAFKKALDEASKKGGWLRGIKLFDSYQA